MSKIKICGLTRTEDIQFVNVAKPDYIGFVFAKSKRQISLEHAGLLKSHLDKEIKAVGVFVNEDINFIEKLCREKVIDVVQLHGDEDEKYVKELRKFINVPIIKAFRIDNQTVFNDVSSDFVLFDTFSKEQYGGTGESFNWQLVKGYNKPFFLAGGLDINNVKAAIEGVNPYCVDVSSGVETDGAKDNDKIKKIVELVRRMEKHE